MNHHIIFVGGIHGVGKSVLCDRLSKELGITHYSASGLIKKITQTDFQKNKRTEQIERNQDVLIAAIDTYLDSDNPYLLDGHFCLLNSSGKITDVPMSTFISMSPISIILLHDDPVHICARIENRDHQKCNTNFISEFQEHEIQLAQTTSNELNVPLLMASPFTDQATIFEHVRKLIKDRGEK